MKRADKMEQSPYWKERAHIHHPVQGYPFREGLPSYPWYESQGVPCLFAIICNDGSHHTARVDDSTQYRAEG